MKRIHFFNCFKVEDAIQSGLRAFNKEAGYPVHGNNKVQDAYEPEKEFHTSKKSLFNLVKLLAILKNIFL
jgi:hypothetical protein